MAKVKGETPDELIAPPFPSELSYLLEVFFELSWGRQAGMGPSPISYESIEAWCKLKGWRLQYWEIRVLKALDQIWLKVMTSDG